MNIIELYHFYKGKKIKFKSRNEICEGIVCGYSFKTDNLLVQVTKGFGWQFTTYDSSEVHIDFCILANRNGGKGYWYICEYDIVIKETVS